MKTLIAMDSDLKTEKHTETEQPCELDDDAGPLLQSFWIRCCAVLANPFNRDSLASEFRYVLYSGVVLWTVFIFSNLP
jgi:hypothetical protein